MLLIEGVTVNEWQSTADAPGMKVQAENVQLGLTDKPWGTEFSLDAQRLPRDGRLGMYVVGPKGTSHEVATWLATENGSARITTAAAMRLAKVNQVVIQNENGTTGARMDVQR